MIIKKIYLGEIFLLRFDVMYWILVCFIGKLDLLIGFMVWLIKDILELFFDNGEV